MAWVKSDLLSGIRGVVHGFSDRKFSGNPEDAAARFGLESITTLNQIHSRRIFIMDEDNLEIGGENGDGIITNLRGNGIGVFTADCVPILLADRYGTVLGVAHAGWRGTLSRIVGNTLTRMKKSFGVKPEDVCAALGPSIGVCCYEVGQEVATLFIDQFDDSRRYLFERENSKYMLDLKYLNRVLFEQAGVRMIEVIDVCTKCAARFYSYRREGRGVGSNLSFIASV